MRKGAAHLDPDDLAFAAEALDELVETLEGIHVTPKDWEALSPSLAKAWAALMVLGLRGPVA